MDGVEPEIIAEMMQLDFDADGNGNVELAEFVDMCKGNGFLKDFLSSPYAAGAVANHGRKSSLSVVSDISVNSSASQQGLGTPRNASRRVRT